ncbi:MAG: hypothetical protein AAGA17_12855 [Actinomycetota bacterium]
MDRRAELSSTASMLEDLRSRLESAGAGYRQAQAEDVAAELEEIERLLRTAGRRLDRLMPRLPS